MQLTLHIGAHRTGSTALQQLCRRRRDWLRGYGIAFWGPRTMRAGRRRDFVPRVARGGGPGARRPDLAGVVHEMHVAFAAEAESGIDHILVSEENLLGAMAETYADGTLYWDARDWLAATAELFPVQPDQIFLCIRDYASLAVSIYSHLICRKPMGPFDDQRMMRLGQSRGWVDVVRDIHTVFPDSRIVVWQYDSSRQAVSKALARMIGPDLARELGDPPRAAGRSASAYAVFELLQLGARGDWGDREAYREEAERIRGALPGPRLSPFSADQLKILQSRFENDWRLLAEGAVNGVELCDPPSMREVAG
ncbi:hypothetical protein LV82_02190 [Albidovulum inexpectatum]|uniref:Sulfotransferase family protein n=1 Tax=Albidovulum inexpectatum TaxID=196587 RepID=A0A2S5JG89_9RHOB|nr:hypothetical protein [Albidovulum inexpectatum]PPB80315.1 hypothetical protein LV82_02190 [Albidovulum inexpectatum]